MGEAIELDVELRISGASALRRRLDRSLGGSGAIELLGEGVRQADTAGLQLLLAFIREARARGRSVAWKGVSTSLRESAQRLGLVELLGLP